MNFGRKLREVGIDSPGRIENGEVSGGKSLFNLGPRKVKKKDKVILVKKCLSWECWD